MSDLRYKGRKSFSRGLSKGAISICMIVLFACGGGDGKTPNGRISLRFKAVDGSSEIGCDSTVKGLGIGGQYSMGMSDLRFYVSNISLYDAQGEKIAAEMAASEFQYKDDSGDVALVDLTSNVSGSCTNTAIAFAEGTQRVNNEVILLSDRSDIASVSFDVGVPQPLMKRVVRDFSIEGAPSPLGEMYWSWASGYRHFVLNFSVKSRQDESGEGYLHLGSRDCGGDGAVALTDREQCGFVNTPSVRLEGFDPTNNVITVDIRKALQNVEFQAHSHGDKSSVSNKHSDGNSGKSAPPGVVCHSGPIGNQPDCGPIFANFGLDPASGDSSSSANQVFSFK